MKSLIIFVLSIILAAYSLQAQGLEVKNVQVGKVHAEDNIFTHYTKNGVYHFSVRIPVICEGKVDSVFAFIDQGILIINVSVSSERLLRCPGYVTTVEGDVKIGKKSKMINDIQFRSVATAKDQPSYYDIKYFDENGLNITPPAFR